MILQLCYSVNSIHTVCVCVVAANRVQYLLEQFIKCINTRIVCKMYEILVFEIYIIRDRSCDSIHDWVARVHWLWMDVFIYIFLAIPLFLVNTISCHSQWNIGDRLYDIDSLRDQSFLRHTLAILRYTCAMEEINLDGDAKSHRKNDFVLKDLRDVHPPSLQYITIKILFITHVNPFTVDQHWIAHITSHH